MEGLGGDGHIHSFSSIFPGAPLDTLGNTVSATEPPTVSFLSGVGCPQDP